MGKFAKLNIVAITIFLLGCTPKKKNKVLPGTPQPRPQVIKRSFEFYVHEEIVDKEEHDAQQLILF